MNERSIQNKLWVRLRTMGHSLIVPNYTPLDWYECDVFSITKAGFMVEHEIKLSASDFRADAAKARERFERKPGGQWFDRTTIVEKKHDLLAAKSPNGPSRFWYVMREGLVSITEVPDWAGVIYLEAKRGYMRTFWVERDAPKLHSVKVRESVSKHALGVMYWRYWHLRTSMKADDPRLSSEPVAPS